MRRLTLLLAGMIGILPAAALGQIDWVEDFDQGLSEARDRDAPILTVLWDYN